MERATIQKDSSVHPGDRPAADGEAGSDRTRREEYHSPPTMGIIAGGESTASEEEVRVKAIAPDSNRTLLGSAGPPE